MKLIGICGDIGSGKDTVADHLVMDHGFTKLSFASKLKSWTLDLFGHLGVERRHIYGGTAKTKQADQAEPLDMLPPRKLDPFTDNEDPWTGRALLEYLGTEVARSIDPDVWVRHLGAKIGEDVRLHRGFEPEPRYVIADLRFENEFNMIRSLGGEVWRTGLMVDHERVKSRGLLLDKLCPAALDWTKPCECGAIRGTGHASDMEWRTLESDFSILAWKPGIDTLKSMADARIKYLGRMRDPDEQENQS